MKVAIALALALLSPATTAWAQLGGGMYGADPIDRIEPPVTGPLPPPAPTQSPDVWVPDRVTPDPVYGGQWITPGHWELPLPNGRYYAPPLTACSSGSGQCTTTPAGEYPPPEMR